MKSVIPSQEIYLDYEKGYETVAVGRILIPHLAEPPDAIVFRDELFLKCKYSKTRYVRCDNLIVVAPDVELLPPNPPVPAPRPEPFASLDQHEPEVAQAL